MVVDDIRQGGEAATVVEAAFMDFLCIEERA
jgi:hypothetical protein